MPQRALNRGQFHVHPPFLIAKYGSRCQNLLLYYTIQFFGDEHPFAFCFMVSYRGTGVPKLINYCYDYIWLPWTSKNHGSTSCGHQPCTPIWGVPKMWVTQNGCFIMENPAKMDDDWGYRLPLGNHLICSMYGPEDHPNVGKYTIHGAYGNHHLIAGWWCGCHQFYFPRNIGNNHPNWLSYFSERWPNHQPVYLGGMQIHLLAILTFTKGTVYGTTAMVICRDFLRESGATSMLIYPLVNIQKTMENHHFKRVNQL